MGKRGSDDYPDLSESCDASWSAYDAGRFSLVRPRNEPPVKNCRNCGAPHFTNSRCDYCGTYGR